MQNSGNLTHWVKLRLNKHFLIICKKHGKIKISEQLHCYSLSELLALQTDFLIVILLRRDMHKNSMKCFFFTFKSGQIGPVFPKDIFPFATVTDSCEDAHFMGFSNEYGILDTPSLKFSQRMSI